ncbi:class F sortase [Streptomyces sp. H10-C2]|uniref:class F sortase n=1 Tax=unclassified Streptomyces TaxID=2593676 RepID=UPI0024B8DD06|nr:MULTISPECIES: class F sortase [unclassified Streptomyces]MDJ0340308.1 class F sortase [Streptomyces sp. PH10-H1]MDJ0368244.1 class F sortase [Streptomyces sp. H10-C2]
MSMPTGSRPRWIVVACLLALVAGGWMLVSGIRGGGHTAAANANISATTPAGPAGHPSAGNAAGTGKPPATAPAPMAASKPVRVRIPSAGVDTGPLLDLGLAADGTVEVPSVQQADRIGWYKEGVTPGELGPAVLIGHFDTVDGPAVLKDIAKVKAGDRITVDRADGSTAVFTVRALEQVGKDTFPTQKVYGDTARPELRLITCGGELRGGHRPDNIIVYADLTS